ncbi:MAG: D-glycero-beta-D-manno-heptose-7-phosphate kinase [Chitinophagaceae bacterium]|nr:D-glycero-beta-D-manno-heptose-7-phosphate kinase [Chitinophagaceae bacterium]
MPSVDFDNLFKQFAQIKVAVIGDVMLDTYWWGNVDRISPEAPVPVVAVSKKEKRIGGAGNVALNLKSLGAVVTVLSVIGDDDSGKQLITLLQQNDIDTSCIIKSNTRPTTNKTRIISRNQQMMRLDEELDTDLQKDEENLLLNAFKKYILTEKPAVVIFEDYNKGVLTDNIINAVIDLCKQHNIITTVDPKRKNFFAYKGVDIFKPNLKEVKEALNIITDITNLTALKELHISLQKKLSHHISLITLSEKGIFFQQNNETDIIATHIRAIADVSGAGDTVIAVASLVYAATRQVRLTAEIANIAGGLVCEQVGTVAIDRDELLNECKRLLF